MSKNDQPKVKTFQQLRKCQSTDDISSSMQGFFHLSSTSPEFFCLSVLSCNRELLQLMFLLCRFWITPPLTICLHNLFFLIPINFARAVLLLAAVVYSLEHKGVFSYPHLLRQICHHHGEKHKHMAFLTSTFRISQCLSLAASFFGSWLTSFWKKFSPFSSVWVSESRLSGNAIVIWDHEWAGEHVSKTARFRVWPSLLSNTRFVLDCVTVNIENCPRETGCKQLHGFILQQYI